MPPNDFMRRRQFQPSMVDTTPLREAIQQEQQAADTVNQLATQTDLIRQQEVEQRRAASAVKAQQAEAAKATREAEQAQKVNLQRAKARGMETEIDPDTAVERIRRHEDDGSPVWQSGFTGGPQAGEDGSHSVSYRDPRGQTFTVPLDAISRKEEPTGAFYEFDIPGADGQTQRIRRPEETGKPLFKVNKENGQRFAEAPDPNTGGMIQQPLGMDPVAANAAAIAKRQALAEQERQARTLQADQLRLEQNLVETEFQPIKERYSELQAAEKKLQTGTQYEQRPDGTYEVKDEFAIKISDMPDRLVKAQAWLNERKRVTDELTKLKDQHDPIESKIQEMKVTRDRLAIQTLNDGHRTQVEIAKLEEAAKQGMQVWQPETQRRLLEATKDPRFTNMVTEGQLADEGNPIMEDLQSATRSPVVTGLAQAAEQAPEVDMRTALDAALPKSAALPDAESAARELGITNPQDFTLTTTEAGPTLVHTATGGTAAFVDVPNNRVMVTLGELTSTEHGQAMARASKVPLFVLAGQSAFTPSQRRDFMAGGVTAAMTGNEEAVTAAGADIKGIRGMVRDGKLSVQDGQWMMEKIHGITDKDLSMPAIERDLEQYAKSSQIETGLWQGKNATPETRAAVVDRFFDKTAQSASGSVLFNGGRLEELRAQMKGIKAGKGVVATGADFLADTSKMLTGSVAGLAVNAVATAGEGALMGVTFGGYEGSERLGLSLDNMAEWNHNAAGFARRVLGADEKLRADLQELRNWTVGALPGDEPPPELITKIKETAFGTYHRFQDDAEAKARVTSSDTFDVTKDPALSQRLDRYLTTRNTADWSALSQMMTMDGASRALADHVSQYVQRPRVATTDDVKTRAEQAGLKLTDGQALTLLDAVKAPIKDAKQAENIKKQVSRVLGMNDTDALLAMDLFTGAAGYDQGSLTGYFRAGMQAPVQEIATEAVSTFLGVKFGQLVARGAIQAAKGTSVAATRRAVLGRLAAESAANISDDFSRLGMFAAKFGKPLSPLQKASNAVVSIGKGVAGDSLSEGIEEGVMGIGEAGSTISTVLQQAGHGMMAAPVMVGGMALLALPMEIRAARRQTKDWDKAKLSYLADVNERLAAIPGTPAFTPDEFEQALTLYGSPAATSDNAAVSAAQEAYQGALAASPRAENETPMPSPEAIQAQQMLTQAVATMQAREALTINAALELRDIPDAQRILFTAVAKTAMGINEYTVAESQALLRLSGPNKVSFVPAPTTAAPQRLNSLDALPSVTLLPGGRMMLAPGSVPVLPAAIVTEMSQVVPSLGQLVNNAPLSENQGGFSDNTLSPVPAVTAPSTPENGAAVARTQDSGASANAAATTAPGVVGPAQGVAEASLANATPVTISATTQGQATPKKKQAATEPQARQVENITRRVISTVVRDAPGLRKLIQERKKAPDYATGGMWLEEDGTVAYHMGTLQSQLGPLNLSPQQVGQRVAALLDEEIRHSANIEASRRLWKKEGAPWDYETWRDAWYGDIWTNQFTEEMRQKVIEAYGETLPEQLWIRAMEGLRMLDQLRATDSITEAVLKHIEAVVQFLRESLDRLTPGVKRELAAMQAVLREFGYENGKVAEKAPKKPRKTTKAEAPAVADNSSPAQTSPDNGNKPPVTDPAENPAPVTNSQFSDTAKQKARAAFEGLASAPADGVDNPAAEPQSLTYEPDASSSANTSANARNLLQSAARLSGGNAQVYFGPEWESKLPDARKSQVASLGTEQEAPVAPEANPTFVGGEHNVYIEPDAGAVIKHTLPGFYGRVMVEAKLFDSKTFLTSRKLTIRGALPSEYLKRWAVVSDIFGFDATYLGQRPGEEPSMAISQPYIAVDDQDAVEQEDIQAFMEAYGFTKVDSKLIAIPEVADVTWYRQKDGLLITDAHERNFRKDRRTKMLVPIDLVVTTVPKGGTKALPDPENEWQISEPTGPASAPTPTRSQIGIPKDRFPAFLDLASTLVEENVTTPEKLAAFLADVRPDGSLMKYAQALWDFLGIVNPSLRGTHDWSVAPVETPASTVSEPINETATDSSPVKVASPVTPKPRRGKKGPSLVEMLQAYFVPGSIVRGYGGLDRVLSFNDGKDSGQWSVQVIGVDAEGKEKPGERARSHFTLPDQDALKKAWDQKQAETPTISAKEQDEARELEITQQARQIVEQGGTPRAIYEQLVTLYQNQPILSAKTSTSKINQAYSTPAPMAFLASRLGDVAGGAVVAEPTAGNGMLLIERQPGQTILANELDPKRRERLASQGIEASGVDATTWTPPQTPDRVIANPPFGQVRLETGSDAVFQTSAGETTSIDHAIMIKSLETMAPDGRAVFIIGGPPPTVRTANGRAEYYRKGKKGVFFAHLYQNFGVLDHFTVNGDLYERQGAGWPLDIIVVQGKQRSSNALPGMKAPRIINTWEELANELDRTDTERSELNRLTEADVRGRVDQMAAQLGQLGRELPARLGDRPGNAGTSHSAGDGGSTGTEQRGSTATAELPRGSTDTDASATPADTVPRREVPELAGQPAVGNEEGSGTERSRQPGTGELTEFQASFAPASGVNPAGLLAPVNLIRPMTEALDRLKSQVGDLVTYVHGKLGYPQGTDITQHFFGDQIDALAQAIHTAENGGALVIGDQTGTGKGRIAAGLMKYAVHRGIPAVFVTKDQQLYDAMMDDLGDIDAPEVVPVLTNREIKEASLRAKLSTKGALNGEDVFNEIAETQTLPPGTNVVFTTYDQIKADDAKGLSKGERATAKNRQEAPASSWRMAALRAIAPEALFILDESHLAGGQSATGWRFGELLQVAKHAYYSSATFAKRPDNMGIYFRTNLGQVGGNIQGLMGLMQAGGVPAMQIGSSMLAQDGQYMRRERSYEGVSFQTRINSDTYERDKLLADNYTHGLRSIILVQERMVAAANAINKVVAAYGKSAQIPVSNRARLESANFSAKLHNLVRQYLLAIKANSAARIAVEAIRGGQKVIVAVENTMESIIEELHASNLPLNFNGVLQMYLNQMRRFKISGGSYGRSAQYLEISEVPDPDFKHLDDQQLQQRIVRTGKNEATGEATVDVDQAAVNELVRRAMVGVFREAAKELEDIDLADMPLSPIDAMRQAVEREDIRTGEMTGRSLGIDPNGEVYNRPSSEVRGKLQAKDAFNNEDLDFLVINKSGSTGVSMHASAKFKNQKPRHMLVVQANLDINEFMQTIGRTHRAGQVHLPIYTNLQTALPAENRPAAILGRKMAMLNANTTSNADSELSQKETVDLFNQYGDEVIHSYLARNPGLVRLIAQSWEKLVEDGKLRPVKDFQDAENGGDHGYLSRSVTGHLAILPVDEQEVFWDTVSADYRALINYLDQLGQNDLRASTLDMKAETLSTEVFTHGTAADETSVFAAPSFLETVTAQTGQKPMSADESQQVAQQARATAGTRQDAFLDRANAWIQETRQDKLRKARNWDTDRQAEWLRTQEEQRDTIARGIGLIGTFGAFERPDGTTGLALVEDVTLSDTEVNRPSSQIAIVRVNDSRDRIKVALSKLGDFIQPMVNSGHRREQMERDAWERSWLHETKQAIITGNLLTAMQQLSAMGTKSRIIAYSKADGSTHMGILLPNNFAEKMEERQKQAIPAQTVEEFQEALNAGRVLRGQDGAITIQMKDGAVTLEVPASRQTGGRYWRDPGLNRLMKGGEFVQQNNKMIGEPVSPAEVFNYLRSAHNEAFTFSIGQADSLASAPAPSENAKRLQEALAKMDPLWRAVLEASMKGEPVTAIAQRHSISEKAVGNVIRVATGRLQVLLDASKDGRLRPTVQVENEKVKASSGEPDKAMSANPAFVAVDQRRGRSEEVTHAEMQDMAQRLFATDSEAAERLVTRWMDSGTTVLSLEGMPDGIRAIVNDAQARQAAEMLMTAAAKLLVTDKSLAGGNSYEIARLIDLYRNTGTEQARALNMRFDPHQKPEERSAMFISESLLTPPATLRDEIRRNPANKERILKEWSVQAQEIRTKLRAAGFDIDATFAAFRREKAAAERAVPQEIKMPLARTGKATQTLVRSVLEGKTWAEAAKAANMSLTQARTAYNAFRQQINDTGTQAATAARDVLLASAPVDYAAQIGLPEWTEDVNPDQKPVTNEATETLAKERTRKKQAGEIDLGNPVDVARTINIISQNKSNAFDKLSEFWRASILSGPQTQVVNLFSGLAFGTYEATVKKMGAGAAADMARMFGMQTDAASLADIPAMLAAVVPSVKRAFADAIRAWKAEASFFNAYALDAGRPGESMVKADMYEPALKGPVGKIMRGISFRLMLLADEFVKSFFTRIEVAAQARQIARSEGLKGSALSERIAELMNPGSEAWVRGLDQALKITFQTELGTKPGVIDQIDGIASAIQRAKKGDFGMLLKGISHFVFPFVATPTNIFKMGVTMSPLGTFLALIDGARSLNQRRKGNTEEAARLYNAARLFDDLVNQIVAWGTVFVVSELVKPGDDEDELPYITGSLPWKATSEGERSLAYRTAPPTSVRIGDRWYNYGRLDPFASSLAFIVDAVKEFQKDAPIDEVWGRVGIQMLTTMQDKTFLQGFSDLMNAVQNPERFGTRWATNIATGFIPNLIRQPIRSADENVREMDMPNDMPFFESLMTRMGYSIVPQSAPPAIDVWGNEEVKGTGTGSPQTDFLLRLLSPVQSRDGSNPDPLDIALQRYNLTADTPFGKTAPDRELSKTVNGITMKASLSDEEWEKLMRDSGKAARMSIGDRFNGKNLSDEDVEMIKKTLERSHALFREQAKRKAFAGGQS